MLDQISFKQIYNINGMEYDKTLNLLKMQVSNHLLLKQKHTLK